MNKMYTAHARDILALEREITKFPRNHDNSRARNHAQITIFLASYLLLLLTNNIIARVKRVKRVKLLLFRTWSIYVILELEFERHTQSNKNNGQRYRSFLFLFILNTPE